MSPNYYRTRVQTVEAHQVFSADQAACRAIAAWCGGDVLDQGLFDDNTRELAVIHIVGLAGTTHTAGPYAEEGDWIVRFQSGEFVAYSDESFRANFDPVVRLT